MADPGERPVPAGTPTFQARQRWAYKVVDFKVADQTPEWLEERLNRLGERGWEVCGFESHRTAGFLIRRVILKRPVLLAAIDDQ